MEDKTPQDVADEKARKKATEAYDAIDKTEPKSASAGAGRGFVNPTVKKMAKGGSASARADGIAQRGKTRGTFIMCGGGMTK